MSLALAFIVGGLFIIFAAFCFAAIHMYRTVTGKELSLGDVFKKCFGAIIVMVFGGLLLALGVILAVINALPHIVK